MINYEALDTLTERFEDGVPKEEAADTLRQYLDATHAYIALRWGRLEGKQYYAVTLMVTDPDGDEEHLETLSDMFNNAAIDDTVSFEDGKNGDSAATSAPFIRSENELLSRFDLKRLDIWCIYNCWI